MIIDPTWPQIFKGVQAIILGKNNLALFAPCSAHNLNLCGTHAVEVSNEVKHLCGNIQKLYNIFSRSPARWKMLQEYANTSLHALSETRWSSRIEAVKPLAKRHTNILKTLAHLQSYLDLPAEIYSDVVNLID